LAASLVLLSAPLVVFAQSNPFAANSSAKNLWTPHDVLSIEVADQFRISPDGKWALWTKMSPDPAKDGRVTNLMLSSLQDSSQLQLTREFDDVSQARWSPDGKKIAFISRHPLPGSSAGPGKPHIWLINPFGGEPWPATLADDAVNNLEWQGDDAIVFSAAESPTLHQNTIQGQKDDSTVVDDDDHLSPVRLFRLDLKEKRATRIIDNDRWIDSFEISPDKKSAVAIESRESSYQWDRKVAPAVWLINLDTGSRKRIFAGDNIHPRVVRWAADNSGIYAIAPFSALSPEPSGFARLVYFYDVTSDAVTKVDLDWEKGVGFLQKFDITSDGFVVFLADGVRFKPARYTRHGSTWSREWIEGERARNYFDFTLGRDGQTIIYEYSTASTPPKWYRAKLDGARVSDATELVDVYASLRGKLYPKTEVIHWTGSNNEEVDGILFYPSDYESGKRYPLVTYTHGGPMGADLDGWNVNPAYVPNLLTQRGAFVLETNYHGSANYGAKWAESICCGKYYELEIPDIESGVDHLIAQGLVDPDRIGAFGWSNGAILSIALNVKDPARYKATVVGAGDVDYVSDWGNSEYGDAFDGFYLGKSMPDDPQLYIQKSPLYQLQNVRTPTLIFHGSADNNVPTEQSWLQYRALYHFQKAPVRFVLFPGEGHFPIKLSHQLRVTEEELAWFNKYLFKSATPKNEALKDGSPLASLLAHPIQRAGSLYGVERAPVGPGSSARTILTPEVVHHGPLEIGRFEITRAQFAAFDGNYKYPGGTENFPASGITYERAKSYCAWLSRLTGETYRLPNEDDAKALYPVRGGENTLDYWAGYQVNPDDAGRLQTLIAGLPPDELIKEVGSFPGVVEGDEATVFDLSGNVAEWTETADGKGKLAGASADRPADPKALGSTSKLSFAGFRVLREPARTQ
jgi:dipeptidyl aminopeptidase/acylaminoacyl peptidase